MSDGGAPGGPLFVRGDYFGPGSARAHPARLIASGPRDGTVRIQLDGAPDREYRIVSVSDRIGRVARRVELAGGGAFVSHDNDALDRLAAGRDGGMFGAFSRVSALERFHPRLVVFVLAIVLSVAFLVRDGIPIAAKVGALMTPPAASAVLDASASATLDRLFFSESALSPERQANLTAAFASLLGGADARGTSYRLLFRDGGAMGANALALPNGSVVLTDQLADLLDEDEVIAVLAPEIAHVEERHALQRIYRAAGLAAVVMLVLGDPTPVLEDMVGGGGVLLAMRASRDMEAEADREGVRILVKAGRDPAALASALRSLHGALCGEACEETGWLDSHPGGIERLDGITRTIEELDG